VAGAPAYAMVGAASVLAGLFNAPLTASLLLFELTHDFDIVLPLLASAGLASLINPTAATSTAAATTAASSAKAATISAIAAAPAKTLEAERVPSRVLALPGEMRVEEALNAANANGCVRLLILTSPRTQDRGQLGIETSLADLQMASETGNPDMALNELAIVVSNFHLARVPV